MPVTPAFRGQKQGGLSEFKASLVYSMTSGSVRATESGPDSGGAGGPRVTRNSGVPFISERILSEGQSQSPAGEDEELWDTHGSRLKVLIREAPLVPVVLIVHQVLLHDLVILVEEQVADGAGGCVLQIIHCNQREEARQVRATPCGSLMPSTPPHGI